MNKITILIILLMSINSTASCQSADSTKQELNSYQQKPSLKAKDFIIPAVFVAYGSLASGKGPLKNLNYSAKNELREDFPFFKSPLDNYAQYVPAATVFGLSLLGVKGRNSIKDEAIIYATAMGINAAIVYPVKILTAQMRPDSSASNSFPSGHTSSAFVAAEFLRKEYAGISPWYGIGGYLLATGTGVFRLYNNKHWLGDIVAGAGIGIASTKLAYFFHDRIKWNRDKKQAVTILPYYSNRNAGILFQKKL